MANPTRRSITAPKGFYAAGLACGIKASGKPDLALIVADRPCAAAGVFSRSRTPGAPLIVSRRHLRLGIAQAIVINSGNANASTGEQGLQDAGEMCRLVAEHLPHSNISGLAELTLRPSQVLVGSTGIIGHPMPMDRVATGINHIVGQLARGPEADADAANAILTTDLATKTAHRRIKLDGKAVHLGGIAKGSGMIAPNMGTMLAYLTTDAAIDPPLLSQLLREAAATSFNRISVDQHTSPSDMVLILANGAAGNEPITRPDDAAIEPLREALHEICQSLAYQIVQDGEGATKVFRVRIAGARSEQEADRVGKTIVDSPLVKTAVHGADPNWGRIVTAAGYSGAPVQPEKMALRIGPPGRDICVFEAGTPNALRAGQQRRLETAMHQREVVFTLELGRGEVNVEWLGCDLSREYITINADYTT